MLTLTFIDAFMVYAVLWMVDLGRSSSGHNLMRVPIGQTVRPVVTK